MEELPQDETIAQMLKVMGAKPENKAGIKTAKAIIRALELVYPY